MCAICDLRIEFSVDHPMTLNVAVATRHAIDAGLLPPAGIHADTSVGMPLRLDAIRSLKGVQRRLEVVLSPPEMRELPDFFALMIESRTWAFFHPTSIGFDPNCRPDPPRISAHEAFDGDAVIVASETALRQILLGKLSFEQAHQEGMIVVDADHETRVALTHAWSTSFPGRGFSRFVCTSWASEVTAAAE